MNSLVFNGSHQPIVSWKGKTFNQITSTIKRNKGTHVTSSVHNLFLTPPLKIYRREIANTSVTSTCSSTRTSVKIDEITRPGGSIINTNFSSGTNGLVNTIDNTLPNNTCEEPGTCLPFLSPAMNARRRCRSAGMIHQKYDVKNRAKYYTDTKQYLTSRNVSFEKNQFRYPTADPNYCVIYNPSNKQFAQQGGVSGSSLIARVKYNAIQDAASKMANPLGIATSNALAYGVPENGYTVKDTLGYPNPSYPSFKNNTVRNCTDNHIRG